VQPKKKKKSQTYAPKTERKKLGRHDVIKDINDFALLFSPFFFAVCFSSF